MGPELSKPGDRFAMRAGSGTTEVHLTTTAYHAEMIDDAFF
jgi:hypothetical protein